ncbi:bacteriophage abortive infection AbiH family protein [Sinomicrobium kalidii]|uniref:AbiH family protein n=1 Tax=Sinomicrobium kalidii TaxID=2900738 RepID=UPI001E4F73A4|nr:AbiH family protein [Sinomicrobium kalidii]UGU14248.1 bacteriophage abortive infection AbiH family protein [Sinomicrobium kalidii]
MNRLILLGNGFDLAHGLKTKYQDFIIDLLKKEIRKALSVGEKKRDGFKYNTTKTKEGLFLIETKVSQGVSGDNGFRRKLESITDVKGLTDLERSFGVEFSFPDNLKEGTFIDYDVMPRKKRVKYPETIIKKTYNIMKEGGRNYNWVDIEGMYYDSLLEIINVRDKKGNKMYNEDVKDNVKFLNSELDFLRNRFVEYLHEVTDIPHTVNNVAQGHFWNGFKGKFIEREIEKLELKEEDHYPQNIQILNFNYTDTIYKYGNHSNSFENREVHVDYNFIHGDIKNLDQNPIIFGYGDETDDHYDVMEKLNDNELLRHIKSFGYFKTDNYYRLLRFIEQSEGYQVFIVGHSCGLSDRVMLKRIFEHKNCKSIQIFYYEWEDEDGQKFNDYTTKTQEISRHFDNKNMMREKIVPEKHCSSMSELSLVRFPV